MPETSLWGLRCERCQHEWLPRDHGQAPKVCPKCKTPYWNRPRRARQSRVEYSAAQIQDLVPLGAGFPFQPVGHSLIVHADCLKWLACIPENCLHAIVTDPPYGVKEYEAEQIVKRGRASGGVWRIPPSFDGSLRAPLPRFTALNARERATIFNMFKEWSSLALRALRPGGHVLIASNAFLSQLVFSALVEGGLEFRGEMIRLVRTFRGGDRPKNAEEEFSEVSSLPRSCYEPWGLFRKALPRRMTVSECLRKFGTGALRRPNREQPLSDVITSERTSQVERDIADHPSLKPQSLLRQLVHAVLPLGSGIIADPFMGSGSTVAAAEALGLQCVGVERHLEYYKMSQQAIPRLARLSVVSSARVSVEQLSFPI